MNIYRRLYVVGWFGKLKKKKGWRNWKKERKKELVYPLFDNVRVLFDILSWFYIGRMVKEWIWNLWLYKGFDSKR